MSYLENFQYQKMGADTSKKLVFMHGLMGSGSNWRRITPSFQDGFQVLTYDQRGHGRSFKPDSGYAPEDFARDLVLILDELGWNKIHLVGHSMGGRNAMQFAFDYPERVEKLVIVDIAPAMQEKNKGNIERLLSLVPTPFESKKQARKFLMTDFVEKLKGRSNAKALSQYFYTNIEEKPDKTADWRFSKTAILESLRQGHLVNRWDDFKALVMPTLVIRGELSEDLNIEDFSRMIGCNSNILGVEIKKAGHWVHSDQPNEFIKVIQNFLG